MHCLMPSSPPPRAHAQAARRGHAPAVAWLLDDAPTTTTTAGTANIITSDSPHLKAFTTAHEAMADTDHFGNTPLHVAAREGHLPVVKTLLARGADPAARNRYGWTALIAASGERFDFCMGLPIRQMSV
jgi:hypothetical protein